MAGRDYIAGGCRPRRPTRAVLASRASKALLFRGLLLKTGADAIFATAMDDYVSLAPETLLRIVVHEQCHGVIERPTMRPVSFKAYLNRCVLEPRDRKLGNWLQGDTRVRFMPPCLAVGLFPSKHVTGARADRERHMGVFVFVVLRRVQDHLRRTYNGLGWLRRS